MKRNKNVVINIPADGIEEEVIINTDSGESEYKKNVKRYIKEFLCDTPCGRVFVNVCYKRSVVYSDVADSYLYNIKRNSEGYPLFDKEGNTIKEPAPEMTEATLNHGYRAMLERGIDIIKMVAEEVKSYGAEIWFSIRMNDHHYAEDRGFNSGFAYDRSERLGVDGSKTYLDYSNKAVRDYYKSFINELCEKYDIDGIELDFLRSCPVIGRVNKESTELISGYVASIKDVVCCHSSKKGKKIGLAARIYPTEKRNLSYGMDAASWIAGGNLDILTLEGWYIPTYYNINVEEWRKSIEKANKANHPYTLLCGTDWAVKCDPTHYYGKAMWISLEQFKGFSSSMYHRGADGIYIFNHFNTNDDYHSFSNMGLYSCETDEYGNEIKIKVLRDKIKAADSLEASETGKRCYVNTYTELADSPYPITIAPGKEFEFEINTGTAPASGYWNIITGLSNENEIRLEVNGVTATFAGDVRKRKDYVYEKGEVKYPFVNQVSETAERVVCFSVDINAVKEKFNHIKISSVGDCENKVKWIEVQTEM